MTIGEVLFIGGIIGIVVFSVLFFSSWLIFNGKKKKLIARIEKELGL